jgi:maltose alpha-D-glucosyltransferase / alpha-amylase
MPGFKPLVWADKKPENAEEGVIFPGYQESTWTYSEEAGAYYFHRFYDHQADLNVANPEVRDEIFKIMGFWLQLGVSGFRVDAVPFLIELEGIKDTDEAKDPFLFLKEIRNFLSWRKGDAIVLAEVNEPMDKIADYFGDGDQMQLLFSFLGNQTLMLALAREEVAPLVAGLQQQPHPPEIGQWAYFVRNHDELTLDKLSDQEQDEILRRFEQDKDQVWIYDRGIRRRFPPLVNNEPRRIRLAYSLMFTLPGTPVLFYGEELGMGDDLSIEERNAIRTPMQWSDQPNAGFSTAEPDELIRSVIDEEPYGYQQLNVIAQRRDPDSLLNWMERAIRMRKECPEFGWGGWEIIETDNPSVLAHRCQWKQGTVIALHNLSKESCTVTLKLKADDATHLIDLLEDQPYESIQAGSHNVPLEGYGYRWFRVGGIHL